MARQNRVTPTGEIVADPAYGTMMGNRGILHDADGRLGKARWRHRNWICCVLEFKGWKRPVMAPGAYTELFFLDEASALAAGHRPCAECRRADYNTYRAALAGDGARPSAIEMDRALHEARLDRRTGRQRRYEAASDALPDGAMILHGGTAHLVLGSAVRPWSFAGYGAPEPRPRGPVEVLTPASSIAALADGYRVGIHPSADR